MIDRRNGFFGLHLDLHPVKEDVALGADITEENLRKLIERARPEFVTYDCKGHPGYAGYETKVGSPAPNIIKDSLAIWRNITKEYGIPLGIHYSGVIDYVAMEKNPEWARVDGNGNKDLTTSSTFGEYVDKLLLPQLKEIIENYDIDYVWLDGECWGTQLDYCPAALIAWKEQTGREEAPKSKEDPMWREWKELHRKQFEKYLKHWTGEVHKYKEGICAASNWAYTTMMPKPVEAPVDIISGDFDPILSVDRARTECRFLQYTGMPWELQSWTFDLVKEQDECAKLPVHLKQEAGVVMMHGGGYMMYFLPTRSGYINDVMIETAGEVAEFCRERKEICFRSTPIPQVAILHSGETQLDRSDRVYTWWDTPLKEVEGVLHAMLELHYSCDVMTEYQLAERLDQCPLVIVPDSHKLTEEFKGKLVEYVKNGGNLLLMGGNAAALFEKELGVTLKDTPKYVNTTLAVDGCKVSVRNFWYDLDVNDAEVLEYRYEGDGVHGRSSYLDIRETGMSDLTTGLIHKYPAATVRKLGKGLIAGVYGPVPLMYFNNHHPYLRNLFKKLAEKLFKDPLVKVEAPSTVDVSLRKSAMGEITVHLLNTTSMPVSERRAFCDFVPEVGPITVDLKLEQKPSAITWEPYNENLDWTWNDGTAMITIPKLHIHGAVRVRK